MRRNILITGSTGGIGAQIAMCFAKSGWNILCHYSHSGNEAKRLKKAIEDCGVDCRLFQADFSSRKQLLKFINTIGRLDIASLVNNAGSYAAGKEFYALTLEDIASAFMINAFAPMLLSSRIFMQMKKKGFGRIVNISSIAAKYGGSGNSMHYGCSKLALEGVTKTLAREGARYNILINTIRPGLIDTDFHRKFPKDKRKRIALLPLKKMGRPQDIADMAYYLGSEKNRFITNEIITISGGE